MLVTQDQKQSLTSCWCLKFLNIFRSSVFGLLNVISKRGSSHFNKNYLKPHFLFLTKTKDLSYVRSSHWRCLVRRDVLKNFQNFTEKHLCWSLFLIKFQFYLFSRIFTSCLHIFRKVLNKVIAAHALLCQRIFSLSL